jgi:hypothetical protein
MFCDPDLSTSGAINIDRMRSRNTTQPAPSRVRSYKNRGSAGRAPYICPLAALSRAKYGIYWREM